MEAAGIIASRAGGLERDLHSIHQYPCCCDYQPGGITAQCQRAGIDRAKRCGPKPRTDLDRHRQYCRRARGKFGWISLSGHLLSGISHGNFKPAGSAFWRLSDGTRAFVWRILTFPHSQADGGRLDPFRGAVISGGMAVRCLVPIATC